MRTNISARGAAHRFSRKPLKFENDEQLFDTLLNEVGAWQGKTLIFAGHHMLIYDRRAGCLVPVLGVGADGQTRRNLEADLIRLRVGNYPEASFQLAVRLLHDVGVATTRIVLLVNDHDFPYRPQELHFPDEVLAHLKREYFRQNNRLPHGLLGIATKYGFGEEILERNDARRSNATLPSKTFYFSENTLRNRFEKDTKAKLVGLPGIRVKGGGQRAVKYVWEPEFAPQSFCLVDESEGCACSGAMMQLFYILQRQGAENLVLFIPHECADPVRASIEGTLSSGFLRFSNIVGVWGEAPDRNAVVRFLQADAFAV